MPANGRLISIVLLAALVAAAGMLFGAVAVPSEHAHAEAGEHPHAEAAHDEALTAGDLVGALLVSVGAIGLVPLAGRLRRDEEDRGGRGPERDGRQALRLAVALASAGAATIHFAVIAQHFEEYWLFGSFFVGAAVVQLAWALLVVVRPSAAVYLVGAFGNAAVAVMWVMSRTAGLPLGPEAGEAEVVGFADTLATAYEVVIAAGALVLFFRTTVARSPLRRVTAVAASTTVAATALTALALLTLTGL